MSDYYRTPEKEISLGVSFLPGLSYDLAGLETAISGLKSLTYLSALSGPWEEAVDEGRFPYVSRPVADVDAQLTVESMRVHRVSLNSPLEVLIAVGASAWPSYYAAEAMIGLWVRFQEARVSRHRANADIAEERLREAEASLALREVNRALAQSEVLSQDSGQAIHVERAARTLPNIESIGFTD